MPEFLEYELEKLIQKVALGQTAEFLDPSLKTIHIRIRIQLSTTACLHQIARLNVLLSHERCPQKLIIFITYLFFSDGVRKAANQEIENLLSGGQYPEHLDIRFFDIGLFEVQAIARALGTGRCAKNLKILLNGHHSNGPGAAQIIADVLVTGKCPDGLSIDFEFMGYDSSKDGIGPIGAQAIAWALTSGGCPYALSVDIGHNGIGSSGALSIAKALESGKCPDYLSICMDWSGIDESGACAVIDALGTGKGPRGLSLNLSGLWPYCSKSYMQLWKTIQATLVWPKIHLPLGEIKTDVYFNTEIQKLISAINAAYQEYEAGMAFQADMVFYGKAPIQAEQFFEHYGLSREFEIGKEQLEFTQLMRQRHEHFLMSQGLVTSRERRFLEHRATQTECSVCLQPYDAGTGDVRRVLIPCSHLICAGCLKNLHDYAVRDMTVLLCPVCRAPASRSEAIV